MSDNRGPNPTLNDVEGKNVMPTSLGRSALLGPLYTSVLWPGEEIISAIRGHDEALVCGEYLQ